MYSFRLIKWSFVFLFVSVVLILLFINYKNRDGCKLYNRDQYEFACNGKVISKNKDYYLDSMPEIVIQGRNEIWSYKSYDLEGLIPKTQIGDLIDKSKGSYMFYVYRCDTLCFVFDSEKDCD